MRAIGLALLSLVVLITTASPARADATAFWGVSPSPATRAAKGFAFGINLLVIGFELEYANTTEDPKAAAPGLRTGMINGLVQTPTSKTQIYLTAGGGFFRERLGLASETNLGTNIGGGIKIGLVGPLRLRLDYRVFTLRGTPITAHPQRFYAGANISF
jgi:opacity protein-like surface antigen